MFNNSEPLLIYARNASIVLWHVPRPVPQRGHLISNLLVQTYTNHFFSIFVFPLYFKRIIIYCLLHLFLSSPYFLQFFSFSLSTVIFYFSTYHTWKQTHPPLSSYSHGMSKCSCPTQWGVQWMSDKTCSALLWHLSEPPLSSVCRDGNEQEWHNMPEVTMTGSPLWFCV